MSEIIPLSFDDFLQGAPLETPEKKAIEDSITLRFSNERIEWTRKVKEMSLLLKRLPDVISLQSSIYTERQLAVEYYHYLISLLQKINKSYTKQYAEKYDYYSNKSQRRFPNERNKELQIISELGDLKLKKDAIENHSKFILGVTTTLDNIIYGIKSRIDIENILNGK